MITVRINNNLAGAQRAAAQFLDTCVSEFNAWKARIGEPERVRVEVLTPTKARRRRWK